MLSRVLLAAVATASATGDVYATVNTVTDNSGLNLKLIGSYKPATDVTAHNNIDKDQAAIESELGESPKDYVGATDIYANGANSAKSSGMRTIKGFSKDLSGEPEFDKFVAYYGDIKYADKWVSGALAATNVDYTTLGDVDFSDAAVMNDDKVREQAIKKGTVYLNIWMYAIHELESAMSKCNQDSTADNTNAAHAWDEGVAFYTGSLQGDGSGSGKLMYALAKKRAGNFGTTDADGNADVNIEVFKDFELGLAKITSASCGGLRGVIDRIIAQGYVPIIQGALKYGYSVGNWDSASEPASGESTGLSKAKAEGATFAAGVLGRLNACSTTDAATVYDNLKIGAASTDFTKVLAAFESNYACLGITCADVGAYPSTRSPCVDTWAAIAGYAPGTNVIAHNMIDLDQKYIETAVGADPIDYATAEAIYTTGGWSPRRTIQGFSKDLTGELEYDKFVAYYGDKKYADKWVSAALKGRATGYSSQRGDADFSKVNDAATREQAIKKGTVYLNIWMYALHELESAMSKCDSAAGADNTMAVHAWDEGVAFYTGTLEGTDGSGSGKLMYALASKRGGNFGTGENVNTAVMDLFTQGKKDLEANKCSAMRATTDSITAKGFIPIIQGVLKYAWSVGEDGDTSLKAKAEAATFAAGVLGRLHACSAADATIVYNNTMIGAAKTDFMAVKLALERQYTCMGITCAEVGGYQSGGTYKSGFSAGCSPPASEGLSTGALVAIIVGAVAGVGAVGAGAYMLMKTSKVAKVAKGGPPSGEVEVA